MAEWFNATVLKTVVGDEPTRGSNPCSSASKKAPIFGAFFCLCIIGLLLARNLVPGRTLGASLAGPDVTSAPVGE